MEKFRLGKVLIANRGEISARIQRTCKKLGLSHVAVASEADRYLPFAREAEELVIIGPPPPKDSYLNSARLIEVAKETGCIAVHPGYGFLSENAEFARAVRDAGLVFIGPTPEAIDLLGSKTAARACVTKAGVPTTPGCKGGLSDEEIIAEATRIGFPVIIKAVGGGGGRGMRVAQSADEIRSLLPRARAESKKNFANEDVYIEKYIHRPRHVEVQVFGDSHGNVIHLGTRDCTTQRRHQKLIEEAPAPHLSPSLREKIHSAAVAAAKSAGYSNAGTAEFLVDGETFYFLEMNTRIQVEHPVTEEITGLDLIELQLRVAAGEKVPAQSDISFDGAAIEFRIYAEDPANGFAPTIGTIASVDRPKPSPDLREDFGYGDGDTVTVHYDAMLSKVIVKGASRMEAIDRAYHTLRNYRVNGLTSNVEFHRWMLLSREFQEVTHDIGMLDREWNKEKLSFLRDRERRDPRHLEPIHGAEKIEQLRYRSQKYSEEYLIEVAHAKHGLFIASPRGESGSKAKPKFCRSSNGFNMAVKSLINEVLEVVPPGEIWRS